MGGGKRGQKPKISYYYMSLHYGICHGPIDSVNQIWIKEKLVTGGEISENSVVYLNDPELFGGEEKEGGIAGAVEIYTGTADQRMTNIAAARFSASATTMPGYRGVASLFFRGYDDAEPSSGLVTFASMLAGAFSDLFDAVNTYIARGGFGWTANNPYLPGAWVHVTSIDRPFAPDLAAVGHTPIEPAEDVDVPFHNYNNGPPLNPWLNGFGSEDLTEIAQQVDAGEIVMTFGYTAVATSDDIDDPTVSLQCFMRVFDADGDELDLDIGEGGGNEYLTNVPSGTVSMVRTMPVGTRRVEYTSRNVFFAVFEDVTVSDPVAFITMKRPGLPLDEYSPRWGAHPNMNPAHIVAECLTNPIWGMGKPLEALDLDSFEYAAQTFFNEYFGLSMQWKEQMKIESFIAEVIDHVQATFFLDPRSGLYRLVPIRGDYDPEALETLDGTNCTTKNRQRKAQGEIINEIVIQYTDHQTEQEKTITFQDLASIAQLGQIVSDTRNYHGIRDPGLANFVGARDIRSASYPLFSCDVEAHRSFAWVFPGAVVKLDVPEDGIVGMVVRVGAVDYGEPGDKTVRFSVTEDIFALETTTYTTGQASLWENPDQDPEPLPYERLMDPPLPMLLRAGLSESDVSDDNYPEMLPVVMGDDPGTNVQTISVFGSAVQPNGDIVLRVLGDVTPTPMGLLPSALAREATSTLTGAFVRGVARPQTAVAGQFLYIDGGNETGEFVMLDSYNSGTDVWTVARGMYDTTPKAWDSGHLVWFCEEALDPFYPGEASAGTEFTVKLLPRTSGGTLAEADATEIDYTPSERPYLPFRPADCQIAGIGFGEAAYTGILPTDVSVTWATRNRLQEDGVALRWEEGSVDPEAGQTTTLRFRERVSQTVMLEITGLTGSSTTIDLNETELETFRFYDVEFVSERDGYESLQAHAVGLDVERLGYGQNYGYDYGENDG